MSSKWEKGKFILQYSFLIIGIFKSPNYWKAFKVNFVNLQQWRNATTKKNPKTFSFKVKDTFHVLHVFASFLNPLFKSVAT